MLSGKSAWSGISNEGPPLGPQANVFVPFELAQTRLARRSVELAADACRALL